MNVSLTILSTCQMGIQEDLVRSSTTRCHLRRQISPTPVVSEITKADRAITTLQEPAKNRVHLSLRWLTSALNHRGVDAFVEYWIALETLSMPNTSDIRPLVNNFVDIYNLSYDEAKERFGIGKLFGLRSRIVHDGQIVPVHAQLLSYLEALYADVLFAHLELPSEERAGSMLNTPGYILDEYLHMR